MAFVFSTDTSYTEFKLTRGWRSYKRKNDGLYACFARCFKTPYNTTGQLGLSAEISRKANMLKTAIVGYDKDKKEIIIIPSIVGNIAVARVESGQGFYYGSLALLKFLLSQGFERKDIPIGRFFADVDNEGNIHVYLDRPIEGKKSPLKGEQNGIE